MRPPCSIRPVALVASAVLAASLAAFPTAFAVASTTPTASHALSASIDAANRQQSVHYFAVFSGHGLAITTIADVALKEGTQTIKVTENGKTGHATVELVDHVAYLRGDAFTLVNYMGFPSSAANRYRNKWISVPKSNHAYASVTADLTLPAALTELKMHASTISFRHRLDGEAVSEIRGSVTQAKVSIAVILYARSSGSPLPVEQLESHAGNNAAVTFGSWNERVDIRAPQHATNIARLAR